MLKFGSKTQHPPAKGKNSRAEYLPSRHALNTLTKGTPYQRSMQNYAKLTPSGASAPSNYQTITDMADAGVSAEPET